MYIIPRLLTHSLTHSLTHFKQLCDKYYDVLAEYRLFAVSKKQSKGDNVRESDPEALSSKPLPVWLTTVLLKYKTSFNIPIDKKPSVLFTHLLTYSLTHSLMHSCTQALTHTYLLTHSLGWKAVSIHQLLHIQSI